MSKEEESRGAVEIITPDENVTLRLEAIVSIAKACEQLAAALANPVQTVTINGNITANAQYGVSTKKRKRSDV